MQNKAKSKSIHFKGLSALRFLAATAVVFHHIEQYKFWKGYESLWGANGTAGVVIDALGHKAVSFFFVLSGFLITYLLLAELRKTGTVAVKKFYVRRVLRIWPLFYAVAIVALFILPSLTDFAPWEERLRDSFGTVLLLYLIILPNLLRLSTVQVVGANQAWSVGVEEQFYFIWPLLIRWFKNKIIQFLIGFVVLKMLLQAAFLALSHVDFAFSHRFDQVYSLLRFMQIEQMAVGGIVAWVLFAKKEKLLSILYSKIVLAGCVLLLVLFFTVHIEFFGSSILEGLVFATLILNISTNDDVKWNLDNALFNHLGNISYGIYMSHTIVIALLLTWFEQIGVNGFTLNLLLYTLAPLLTILISHLSYTYFETFFLRYKNRFAVVKSSTNRKS